MKETHFLISKMANGRKDFSNIVKNAKEYIKMYDAAMAANRNDTSKRLFVPREELLWNERCAGNKCCAKNRFVA